MFARKSLTLVSCWSIHLLQSCIEWFEREKGKLKNKLFTVFTGSGSVRIVEKCDLTGFWFFDLLTWATVFHYMDHMNHISLYGYQTNILRGNVCSRNICYLQPVNNIYSESKHFCEEYLSCNHIFIVIITRKKIVQLLLSQSWWQENTIILSREPCQWLSVVTGEIYISLAFLFPHFFEFLYPALEFPTPFHSSWKLHMTC